MALFYASYLSDGFEFSYEDKSVLAAAPEHAGKQLQKIIKALRENNTVIVEGNRVLPLHFEEIIGYVEWNGMTIEYTRKGKKHLHEYENVRIPDAYIELWEDHAHIETNDAYINVPHKEVPHAIEEYFKWKKTHPVTHGEAILHIDDDDVYVEYNRPDGVTVYVPFPWNATIEWWKLPDKVKILENKTFEVTAYDFTFSNTPRIFGYITLDNGVISIHNLPFHDVKTLENAIKKGVELLSKYSPLEVTEVEISDSGYSIIDPFVAGVQNGEATWLIGSDELLTDSKMVEFFNTESKTVREKFRKDMQVVVNLLEGLENERDAKKIAKNIKDMIISRIVMK